MSLSDNIHQCIIIMYICTYTSVHMDTCVHMHYNTHILEYVISLARELLGMVLDTIAVLSINPSYRHFVKWIWLLVRPYTMI